jgi:hypothetical protein
VGEIDDGRGGQPGEALEVLHHFLKVSGTEGLAEWREGGRREGGREGGRKKRGMSEKRRAGSV